MVLFVEVSSLVLVYFIFGLCSSTLALPPPKFEGIAHTDALAVATVGAEARERNTLCAIKRKLLGNNFKGGGALMMTCAPMGTADNFLKNAVCRVLDVIGDIVRRHRNLIMPFFRIAPCVALLHGLIFGQREVFLGYGFVVGKGR